MKSQRRLDRYISIVLHIGMYLSILVIAIGLMLYALYPTPIDDISLKNLPQELMDGSPIAVISLGILLLIMTPLSRVIAAGVIFAVDREIRFVLTSLFILAAILLAIMI
ncbi:MAG: DUF1634 domain-containing protein [Euryarchaeota archaeon]|nr:DUF1634 domain-containing protein [Euryarchaeota archaeon]